MIKPNCPNGDYFVNDQLECQLKSSCGTVLLCGDSEGAIFDEELNGCFCTSPPVKESDFCDAQCETDSLKVFIRSDGSVEMQAGAKVEHLDLGAYLDVRVDTSDLACPFDDKCKIVSQRIVGERPVGSHEATADLIDIWTNVFGHDYVSIDTEQSKSRLL